MNQSLDPLRFKEQFLDERGWLTPFWQKWMSLLRALSNRLLNNGGGVAFSALPAASMSTMGQLMVVTDSMTTVWGAVITGGGTDTVLAFCNGSDWTVCAK